MPSVIFRICKIFFVFILLPHLFLSSCKTSEENSKGKQASLSNTERPLYFDGLGKSTQCLAADPNSICPAMALPIPQELQSRCDAVGGEIRRCGACGNTILCSKNIIPTFYDSKGEPRQCLAADPNSICPAMDLPIPQELQSRCDAVGGEIRRCGACGNTILCSKNIMPTYYDSKGEPRQCLPSDPNSPCPAMDLPVPQEFQSRCDAVGGEIRRCGACENTILCSKNIMPTYYDSKGEPRQCLPSDPNSICPAMALPVPQEFQSHCDAVGGEIRRCGSCGNTILCTSDLN
jgi:hypothetical protein